jgi:hypothetical protein
MEARLLGELLLREAVCEPLPAQVGGEPLLGRHSGILCDLGQ